MPRQNHRLTLRSPSGTLGMEVATQVTMRVVTIPLTVIPRLASELEPPPPLGTSTGTLLWSGMSVMGLTKLSVRWKGSDDSSNRWMTHRPARCMTSSVTSGLTLMLKSCKDLSLGEMPGA
jgi:hypothetical protein